MEYDNLLRQAAELIVKEQTGTTSLLQRRLMLGYNRAGRIVDQLEGLQILGEFQGVKAREVKVKNQVDLDKILIPLNL